MDQVTVSRELLRQVLDALEFFASEMTFGQRYTNEGQTVIDAPMQLRTALEQPAVEPLRIDPKNDPLGMRAAYTAEAISDARARQHRHTNEFYTRCKGTNCTATAVNQKHSVECMREHDEAVAPQAQQPAKEKS